MSRRFASPFLLALTATASLAAPPDSGDPPGRGKATSPEASRRAFHVAPGFVVELMASEPLVEDPIAFEWGADGRLWVVEMGDYPLGVDGRGKPGGKVRTLEDRDGDGRYDASTLFLDGLAFPTGLYPWRHGWIIACAPEIFYAEDQDGDGKADRRVVLFTGFREGNQQHRVNGFDFGLDGWLYGANGDSGGNVRSLKTGVVTDINHRDFRFQPDDGRFEAESGSTQYGRHRDDWGRWFGNNNPNWAWHFVLADGDLKRNRKFAPPDPRQMLEPDTALFPRSVTAARFNDPQTANRVTSANSPTPYRDDLFGPEYAASLFVSEPVHNLVHRMALEPNGATLRGRRGPGEETREFLASSDPWTRPTMLKTGPDGALWIADMYRAVIEHPQWIPDDWEAKLDLRAGSKEGRIFRVYPSGARPRPIPRLDRLDPMGLAGAMESSSGWQRDTAERLLLHGGGRKAVAALERLAGGSPRPQVRIQALWTLKGLDALTRDVVVRALSDPDPRVRRNGLQAGGPILRSSEAGRGATIRLATDPDAAVRLEAALRLGDLEGGDAGRALAGLIRSDPGDGWIRAAVLSGAGGHAGTILGTLFGDGRGGIPPSILEPLVANVLEAADRPGLSLLIDALERGAGPAGRHAPWQLSAWGAVLDAVQRSGRPLFPADRKRLEGLEEEARRLAADPTRPDDERLPAIQLLGRDPMRRGDDRDLLAGLLAPRTPPTIQQAAVAALARGDDPRTPETLLGGWKGHSPSLRSAILDTLLSRGTWTAALLSSLEDTCTPPAEIDPGHRRRLLDHRDPVLRGRAAAIFRGDSGPRRDVVAAYKATAMQPGDAAAGSAVFKRLCASCHRLGGEGSEVGPDLSALADRSPEALLIAILDPNRAFESKYSGYQVQTKDGRILSGMIAGETANAVTLRRQEGKEDVLLRDDIEAMAASGQSLMPEGLEKDLKPKDLADLVALLERSGPPPRVVAGNHPERVSPGADGSIRLTAETAELYGETLTYEPEHRNLGYWGRTVDRAAWRFVVERPGRYAVTLHWACADESAGNTLVLEADGQRIIYKVPGTGRWETYREAALGVLDLDAGSHRLEAHPGGSVRGALLDLQSIELRPVAGAGATPRSNPK